VLPLRTGLDAYGVMLYAHPELDFLPGPREVLELVSHQAVLRSRMHACTGIGTGKKSHDGNSG